jgi:hypothetical protein
MHEDAIPFAAVTAQGGIEQHDPPAEPGGGVDFRTAAGNEFAARDAQVRLEGDADRLAGEARQGARPGYFRGACSFK